jgi:tRNA-2-methylthio-N6-dimethylallyladenosine synthase
MKKYLVRTFGCQMNVHDSRRIEEVLDGAGWSRAQSEDDADLLLFNTCSVREKAEHKLRSAVGWVREHKRARPGLVVAVAGCVAQQEGERLLRDVPFLDVVLGPDHIPELPDLVESVREGGPPVVRTVFDLDAPAFLHARPRGASEVTALVTVMKGCDERCTFCIVPYTRGPERYRAADDVISEIRALVAGGVREVTLLGQTVNSWYDPREPLEPRARRKTDSHFADLLRRIAREVPDLLRLRYTSPHPRHVTPGLVAAHAELDLLPAHVHLPAQSGSDRVLRRMNRRYTRAEYLERAAALRAARPGGVTLSTDLIVGFPGETDDDFEQTLSLVREAGFVAAFGFKYSPRPHTPALALGDDVPERVKDERLARLFEVVAAQQRAHLASLVGTRTRVLVEGPSRDGSGRVSGRSERHEIVHVDAGLAEVPPGALVEVLVTEAHKHSLAGRVERLVLVPAAPLVAVPGATSGGAPGGSTTAPTAVAGVGSPSEPTGGAVPRAASRRVRLGVVGRA